MLALATLSFFCVSILLNSPAASKPLQAPRSIPLHPPRPAFDGQYVYPTVLNSETEWWWSHAVADDAIGANPPASIQVIFFMGYLFGPPIPVISPQFYISVTGNYADGRTFSYTLPALNGVVTSIGQEVDGLWLGAGRFKTSADLSTYTITFDGLLSPIKGTIKLTSNAPHHFGCNSTTSPYFDSDIPSGRLTESETKLYSQIGWPATIPGGKAVVDLKIAGKSFQFEGTGYHDQNWMPEPIQNFISTWYFGAATVGPYTFSYLAVRTIDSDRTLTTGFLARDGIVLQNQCGTDKQGNDRSSLTPFGVIHNPVSGVDVPQGYNIDYILTNGEQYSFQLTEIAEVVDMNVYHQSVGSVKGGKVGEEPSEGHTVFEWLNPGLVTYTPSS